MPETYPLNAYIDTGGWLPIVGEMERNGLLRTHYYPFEQRNKRVRHFVAGSSSTFDQGHHISFDEEVGSFDDELPSDKFKGILLLTGGHRVDAQHLDSAFKAKCRLFLTADKTDIWSKRYEIWKLLMLRVIHTSSETEVLQGIVQNGLPQGEFKK